jgi:hypothetical protein
MTGTLLNALHTRAAGEGEGEGRLLKVRAGNVAQERTGRGIKGDASTKTK